MKVALKQTPRKARSPESRLRFLLRAFIGGTSNQSYTDAQVLDTVAEGAIDGSLTVVKTGGGGSSVAAVDGKLEMVGSDSDEETGVYSEASARVLGIASLFTVNLANTNKQITGVGWLDAQDMVATSREVTFQFSSDGMIDARIGPVGAGPNDLAAYSGATDYNLALILGGYDINGTPFKTGDTVANFKYGGNFLIKGGAFTNWTLLWRTEFSNTTPLYSGIQMKSGTAAFSNILIPELPLDVNKMVQPRFLATFQGTNGDSIRNDYHPDVVDSISDFGLTALESNADTWDIQGNEARNTPGMDADIAPDNTCTTDVARTEVNDTSSWTNNGMATFESVTETGEPNGNFSLHLVANSSNVRAYITVSTVVGRPYRLTVIYKKNAATDDLIIRVGVSENTSADANRVLSSASWASLIFQFVASATTSFITIVENGANDNSEVWVDTLIVEPITLNELFTSDDLGIDEGIFDISGTISGSVTGQVGMGLFLDSYINPQNGLLPYYNRLISKAQLFKLVGGVGTSLINVAATYSANAQLRVIAYRDGADLLVRLYYNKEFIGTEQTISDVGIVSNTRHGVLSVDPDNRISILSVMKRTDPLWDAEITRGTGGGY